MRLSTSVIVLLAFGVAAVAQTPSASVVGRVADPTGAVIPGVVIKVTNLDTNITGQASSNAVGDFTVPYLNPGRYTLEATAVGFRAYRHAEFTLALDQVLRIDIGLEIGAATESVTVTEAAPALNTESGARGEVTTNDEITELPLDGRNFSDLAYLTGGVIPKGDGGDGQYAVNGARADNVSFLIDGMNNVQRRNTGAMITPPLEGVQEFKMMTSGYSAEFGRFAGGILSVVMKSGTNRFRGALYEFLRNDVWDATGYFDSEKSKLRRNQFGATLTGPVFVPRLFDGRNRTFFTFTWESLRVVDGKTQRGIVPLPEMLQGDFSRATDPFGKPLKITDTLAKAPFPNNQIPASRIDPVSAKMAAYFPQPNLTGSANNFISQGNGTTSHNNLGIKVDHQLTHSGRLTGATYWKPNSTLDPVVSSRSPLPFFGLTNNTLGLLAYLRYLHSIKPTMFLEVSASFSRLTNNQVWPHSPEKDWAASIGFPGATNNPIARGLPEFTATGYIPLGPAYDVPKIWVYNNYQYTGSLTWIHGRHNLKFGGDFLRYQYFNRQYGDTRGRLTFNGRFSSETFADMLLGWPSSSRRQLDAAGPYHLISSYSSFVQDDFRVTSTLTLNIGLRWEIMKPPHEKFNAWSMYMPDLGKQVIAGKGVLSDEEFATRIKNLGSQYVVMAADVGLPNTITKPDWNNLAPRFGFAWRPLGNTRSVVRGGYGIFYGSSSLYRMDEYSDTYPFSINETFSINGTNPLLVTASNPFPTDRRSIGGTTSSYGQSEITPKTQYLQSWNLTMEREFAHGTVLEIAYAGSKGTHLQRRYDINQNYRDQALRTLRPYPGFSSIQIISDSSNSHYNSGSLTIRRRFSKQLFVRAAYTFAKSIDEASNTGGTIQYNFSSAQDSHNLSLERGRSDFDIGHAFAASFIWTPNFSKNVLLKDWQLAGSSTIYTGPPFTPKLGSFDYNSGGASRPDRLAKGTLPNPTIDQWFDRTAFPAVPVGSYRFGTSGRNILDGPGTTAINTSISRRIRFGEGSKALQFRLEAFNLPNHPNFNLPENRVDIISGGTISRVKNNRTLQMGARLEF
jgi:Carboxypeptidase regulatory-like domain/TonB-dependent Receptor Plug Domain